jgi:hypothetical protein
MSLTKKHPRWGRLGKGKPLTFFYSVLYLGDLYPPLVAGSEGPSISTRRYNPSKEKAVCSGKKLSQKFNSNTAASFNVSGICQVGRGRC